MNRQTQATKQPRHDTVVNAGDDHGADRLHHRDRTAERRSADPIGRPRLVEGQAGLDDPVRSKADLSEYLHLVSRASDEFGDVAPVACPLADRRGDVQVVAWSNEAGAA